MLFAYRAVSPEGRLRRGQLEAASPLDLETRLQRLDLDLVSCRPARHRSWFGQGGVPRRELINFFFHLEQISRSGIPLLEGLADLRDAVDHPRFRDVAAGLVEGIEGGQPLSEAMAGHPRVFSPVLVNLIRAGETAGQLPEVLAELTAALKWEDELAAHTRQLLVYPALVGLVVLATTAFLMAYLVPQLKQFVSVLGRELPLQTRALFLASDLLIGYWPAFILAPIAAALAAGTILHRHPPARLWADGLKLRLPVVGAILKKMVLARLAGTFAMLYAAGIPVVDAVRTTREVAGNGVLHHALQGVEEAIQEGRSLSAAFGATGLFPPLVLRMLGVGENTGNLDEALRNVSYFYSRDVRERVENAQSLLEPAMTLALGGVLGWIMVSVLGPIYDVVTRIAL